MQRLAPAPTPRHQQLDVHRTHAFVSTAGRCSAARAAAAATVVEAQVEPRTTGLPAPGPYRSARHPARAWRWIKAARSAPPARRGSSTTSSVQQRGRRQPRTIPPSGSAACSRSRPCPTPPALGPPPLARLLDSFPLYLDTYLTERTVADGSPIGLHQRGSIRRSSAPRLRGPSCRLGRSRSPPPAWPPPLL